MSAVHDFGAVKLCRKMGNIAIGRIERSREVCEKVKIVTKACITRANSHSILPRKAHYQISSSFALFNSESFPIHVTITAHLTEISHHHLRLASFSVTNLSSS